MIYTAVHGSNSDLIAKVCELYVNDGQTVADVTYGTGAFWKKTSLDRFTLLATDLKTTNPTRDFRRLKYEGSSIDHVVLDPPYMHNAGKPIVESRYKNAETTRGMYHNDIMKLYRQGMVEALRVLKTNGMLWLKCQDEIESGYQRWSHVELFQWAIKIGFYGKDMFVLSRKRAPVQRNQQHARKTHSYLWIFQKPDEKLKRYMASNDIQ